MLGKAKPEYDAAKHQAAKAPKGRPRRFAKYEAFEASLPRGMTKRPSYYDSIGIFNGAKEVTVWVKVRLPRGGIHRGRSIPVGGAVEIKLGHRSSWDWPQLLAERDRLQGLADRGEALEKVEVPTFAQYAAEWLERRKPTMKSYSVTKGNIASALNPSFGKKALDAISVSDVNQWISKQSSKLKPASVQRHLAVFNSVMNDAIRSGLITHNPSTNADKIRGIEARQRFVTEDEWQTILETVDRIEEAQADKKAAKPQQIRGWLRHYVTWAYNSGMRRAEILNLTLDDIRKVDDATTVALVSNTKTGKPRSVRCTEEMKASLGDLEALPRAPEDNRLFPLSMTTLKRALSLLWKETGLRDVRLHDLRRSHATILINQGVDVRTVAGRLGHSGTAMLAKHYAVNLGDLEAVRAFENRNQKGAPKG